MKTITTPIVLMLAGSLLLAGCDKAGKLSEKSKFTPPSGPVELKQKWPIGERIVKGINMKMDMDITVPNQPNPIKQATTLDQKYGIQVLRATPDGGRAVEMEFLSIKLQAERPGSTPITYDSDASDSDNNKDRDVAAIRKMFKGIIGSKLQYFLDASNTVERVEGVDALMGRLGAASNTGFKDMYNEAYLREMLGDSRYLPPNPVQPNDTWPVQFEMDLGNVGHLMINYNMTFEGWEQHGQRMCARLAIDGTIKSTTSGNNAMGMAMSIDNGTTTGTSWFDPELGATIDSAVNQDLNMTIKVPARVKGKTTTQTVKMLMHQVLNIKLDSLK